MISGVKDISLGFITSLNTNVKTCQDLNNVLSNIVSPGDFLEKLPDFKSAVIKLDTSISRDKNNIQYLISEYKQRLEEAKATISGYITRIQDRILSPDQMNINVSFYDEENQLSKSFYHGFDEDPSHYSMLSIMKRIMNDEEDNLACLEKALNETRSIYEWYIHAQSNMLNIKTRLNDNEFTKLFTLEYLNGDGEKEIQTIQRYFDNVSRSCTNAKKMITEIFQMFITQERDYAIYATAVERFEQHALESYFSTGSVTSGIL